MPGPSSAGGGDPSTRAAGVGGAAQDDNVECGRGFYEGGRAWCPAPTGGPCPAPTDGPCPAALRFFLVIRGGVGCAGLAEVCNGGASGIEGRAAGIEHAAVGVLFALFIQCFTGIGRTDIIKRRVAD